MPCFKPIQGYRSKEVSAKGKRPIVFNPNKGFIDLPQSLPCGQCVGCRLERSRQWAIRCYHEASLYDSNCFITLTFAPFTWIDSRRDSGADLIYREFQLFMKRFRKRFGANIRFYMCGEYGEQFGRPHFHACIFNFDFADKVLWKVNNGNPLYTSQALEELWPFGYSSIGNVTFESAAYVARYIMKKVTGDAAEQHYSVVDPDSGEVFKRTPEFTNMSRRSGIGKDWFLKFVGDVYPDDFVVMRGKKMRPPRYYDSMYESMFPYDYDALKRGRVLDGKRHADNNTPERLRVREQVVESRLKSLPRVLA